MDEENSPKKIAFILGSDVENQSIQAIQEIIGNLRLEISRLESIITKKQQIKSQAEALFR